MKNRQYIISERAHLMCPNMHFGIRAKIMVSYDVAKFQQTCSQLEAAHPFLQSLIEREEETGKLFYALHKESHVPIIEKGNSKAWETDYKAVTAKGWDVFKENMLKIIVYPSGQTLEFIFVAHHLLGDGRAILGLVNEFIECYIEDKQPIKVEEQLLSSIEDLPQGSDLPFMSKLIINSLNKKWQAEQVRVTYSQYHDFEMDFIHKHAIYFEEEAVPTNEVNNLLSKCRSEKISLNDYLIAEMMLKENTNKVVIAADIRKQLACYHKDALGNYATAMGIVCKKHHEDIWLCAKEVSYQIKKHLAANKKAMLILACYFRMLPELIDAVAIATLSDFPSKAAKFVGAKMFGYEKRNGYSITNLGNICNPYIIEATFIPPATPANQKTMGILSANGYMKKCTVIYR